MATPTAKIITTGGGRYQKITVASLCCDMEGANYIPFGTTVSHHAPQQKAYPPSRAPPSQSMLHQRDGHSELADSFLPRHGYPRHQSGVARSFSICRDSEHCTGSRVSETAGPLSRRLLQSTAGGNEYLTNQSYSNANVSKGRPAPHKSTQGRSRPNRPSYTEEQKFFIMYHRVAKELTWPEREREFAKSFGPRTTDGLTSVYYRVRRSWNMDKLAKTELTSAKDRAMLKGKSVHFSEAVLRELGCLEKDV